MPLQFPPPGTVNWFRLIEAKLQQHETDIQRLWIVTPPTADVQTGVPYTGPLSVTSFVEPPSSRSSPPSSSSQSSSSSSSESSQSSSSTSSESSTSSSSSGSSTSSDSSGSSISSDSSQSSGSSDSSTSSESSGSSQSSDSGSSASSESSQSSSSSGSSESGTPECGGSCIWGWIGGVWIVTDLCTVPPVGCGCHFPPDRDGTFEGEQINITCAPSGSSGSQYSSGSMSSSSSGSGSSGSSGSSSSSGGPTCGTCVAEWDEPGVLWVITSFDCTGGCLCLDFGGAGTFDGEVRTANCS